MALSPIQLVPQSQRTNGSSHLVQCLSSSNLGSLVLIQGQLVSGQRQNCGIAVPTMLKKSSLMPASNTGHTEFNIIFCIIELLGAPIAVTSDQTTITSRAGLGQDCWVDRRDGRAMPAFGLCVFKSFGVSEKVTAYFGQLNGAADEFEELVYFR